MIRPDLEVDATGMYCPLPILRLERALRDRLPGSIALLIATDPASVEDVEVFCREGGHEIVESSRDAARFLFFVKRGA
jgi:tRNA 2-thiouridine synthesizing protein A